MRDKGLRGCSVKIDASDEWPYAWCFGEAGHDLPHTDRHGRPAEAYVVPLAEGQWWGIDGESGDGVPPKVRSILDAMREVNKELLKPPTPGKAVYTMSFDKWTRLGAIYAAQVGTTVTAEQIESWINRACDGNQEAQAILATCVYG